MQVGLADAERRSGFEPEQVSLQMWGAHPVWRLENAALSLSGLAIAWRWLVRRLRRALASAPRA